MKKPYVLPINLLSDGHVHTRLCNHATGEMEEYVLAAINKGLQEIIFLEHLESGINYHEQTWLSEEDFDYYFEEGCRLRSRYSDQIHIGMGVELGYNPSRKEKLLEILSRRTWDRVGISCHFLPIPDNTLHLNLLSRYPRNIATAQKFGVEKILTSYFDTLLQGVQELPGTVLCHLDAALRHVPDIALNLSHFQQIDTLLTAMSKKNMALEVNTSGIDLRKKPFPDRDIIAMALARNIPLQAGSDAHRPQDVARHFATLPDYLTSAACL